MREELVPIVKAKPGARNEDALPTVRFNPRNGVAALSINAHRMLGEPRAVGLSFNPDKRWFVVDPQPGEEIARKLSPKRTFSITGLREYVGGEEARSWPIWWNTTEMAWTFSLE